MEPDDAALLRGLRLAPAATVTAAVRSRFSCRAFTEQQVSEADVRELLTAASRACSGGNLQPWKVAVLFGSEKERLAEACTGQFAEGKMEAAEYPIYPDMPKDGTLSPTYKERRKESGKGASVLLNSHRDAFSLDTTARHATPPGRRHTLEHAPSGNLARAP